MTGLRIDCDAVGELAAIAPEIAQVTAVECRRQDSAARGGGTMVEEVQVSPQRLHGSPVATATTTVAARARPVRFPAGQRKRAD